MELLLSSQTTLIGSCLKHLFSIRRSFFKQASAWARAGLRFWTFGFVACFGLLCPCTSTPQYTTSPCIHASYITVFQYIVQCCFLFFYLWLLLNKVQLNNEFSLYQYFKQLPTSTLVFIRLLVWGYLRTVARWVKNATGKNSLQHHGCAPETNTTTHVDCNTTEK